MRAERILCVLMACIAIARSRTTESKTDVRSKRDLKFLKDLISAKIFGEKDVNCTSPVVIREEGNIKYFRIPGFQNILVKAVPKSAVVVDTLATLPHTIEELNPTLSVLEHYLGTNTPDETLEALQGLKKLLESGILAPNHEAIGIVPAVKQVYTYPSRKPIVLFSNGPKVPLVPVLPPSIRHPVPIFNEMIPVSVNASPIKMPVPVLSKYSYKQVHKDGTMTSYNARRHGEVIVTNSMLPPPPLPTYILDRFKNIIFEPIGATPVRMPIAPEPIAPLPIVPQAAMFPLPPAVPLTPIPIMPKPLPPLLHMAPLPIAPPPMVLPALARPSLVLPPVAPLPMPPQPVASLPMTPVLPPLRHQPTIVLPKRIMNNNAPSFNPLMMASGPAPMETPKFNRYSYQQANIDGSITNYFDSDVVNTSPEVQKSMFMPGPSYLDSAPTSKGNMQPSRAYSYDLRNNQKNEQSADVSAEPHLYKNPLSIPDESGKFMFRHINRAVPYDLTVSNDNGKLRFNHNSDVHVTSGNPDIRPEDDLIPTKLMPHVGMYPYRQITHNGKLFTSRFAPPDTLRPAVTLMDTSFMPPPPLHIMNRIESVGAMANSAKPIDNKPTGYSYKIVNNGTTIASYTKIPSTSRATQTETAPVKKTEAPTAPVVSTMTTPTGGFTVDLLNTSENDGQKSNIMFSSPVPSKYTYKQINHSNPRPITVVQVEQEPMPAIVVEHEHIGPDGNKYLCKEDHSKNVHVDDEIPKNFVYIPPMTANVPLPTNKASQFSYKQTSSHETTGPVTVTVTKVTPAVTKPVVAKKVPIIPTTLPPDTVTVSERESFHSNPIVVPDVTSSGPEFSYTQTNSTGSSMTVQGDNNNEVSVKFNEVEKPDATDRFRSDIPDAFS